MKWIHIPTRTGAVAGAVSALFVLWAVEVSASPTDRCLALSARGISPLQGEVADRAMRRSQWTGALTPAEQADYATFLKTAPAQALQLEQELGTLFHLRAGQALKECLGKAAFIGACNTLSKNLRDLRNHALAANDGGQALRRYLDDPEMYRLMIRDGSLARFPHPVRAADIDFTSQDRFERSQRWLIQRLGGGEFRAESSHQTLRVMRLENGSRQWVGRFLGQGSFGAAYCIDGAEPCTRVIKFALAHDNFKSNLFLADRIRSLAVEHQAERRILALGLPVARTVRAHPRYFYLIKEYAPGKTLRSFLHEMAASETINTEVMDAIVDLHWHAYSRKIVLDPNASNYVFDEAKKAFVIVDPWADLPVLGWPAKEIKRLTKDPKTWFDFLLSKDPQNPIARIRPDLDAAVVRRLRQIEAGGMRGASP